MKRILRNITTLTTRPAWIPRYLKYRMALLFRGEAVVKMYEEAVEVGGYNGFGEYVNLPSAVGSGEEAFFRANRAKNDQAFIDVGANLGFVTLLFSKLNPQSTVYAFEAGRSTFDCLRENIERNSCSNVLSVHAAITDREGTVFFNEQENSRATAKLTEAENDVSVQAITLDKYAASKGINHVKILKVDVEGHEAGVFRGASNLLNAKKIELIYFEYCPVLEIAAGYAKGESLTLLESFGYEVFGIDTSGVLVSFSREAWDDRYATNLVAKERQDS